MAEEEEEAERLMMIAAEIAAQEILQMEEDEGLEGVVWDKITININEFHAMNDECFKLHFRMSRRIFENLCRAVRQHLISKRRLIRERTPIEDIMLMVIWLLATPDSFRSISPQFGVTPGVLYYFFAYVIMSLREMSEVYMTWPTAEERATVSTAFLEATGFPGIVGCIDGTHVYITGPVQNAASYRNRYRSYSINVQAVVDNTLLVRDLVVGEVGSMHDARVFRRSALHHDLLEGTRLDPDEHLVGDGAYVLTDFMMIPFDNHGHLNHDQMNFNRRLSQARVRVENAFGRAKGKWRRLKFLHARNQAIVVDHITASFVIHNFIILGGGGEDFLIQQELGRPIGNHEVLGNEHHEPDEELAEIDDREQAAQRRGVEKRNLLVEAFAHI
ncbi:hypothetical protein FOCC_FOCC008353 [Frankliniella occidentalis]|nr:hypothetical protein FOCC_FOCC008353 [Frankliniella occidentalis]